MEDILKFLLVAGVIIIGFVRQARKEARHAASPSTDENDMPFPHEARPLPENWEGIPIPPPAPQPKPTQPKGNKRKQAPQPFIPKGRADNDLHRSTHPDGRKQTEHPTEPENTAADIDIRSAEEVRRGIIWAEILKRKY